jgi:hypothetical protein
MFISPSCRSCFLDNYTKVAIAPDFLWYAYITEFTIFNIYSMELQMNRLQRLHNSDCSNTEIAVSNPARFVDICPYFPAIVYGRILMV